ncbi:Asp-tRNAAsn/Glu-tRNAGln amidotransferase C subunit [Caldisphaera lagunensis DSM 15908]|uniref:Asp-tRNAAsn/Glu-tRNAGln amidotransferase C subunit n=1 Tax=Caldisphaera lagunensis (strain DSM 15908 / JCM 11604 / ANMR 0165 / IC-154) TaxID=1056495 RepID=L0ACU9_CALLD|nr:Asp-tRNAAsn/Glu-tRNAGln amidotransferase C subunit [Caldisphaera lagunensis]AFZ71254.1 Asp-tRNAAsn/Glu-tRNAGln amidotransferase C subunit [Caldisphaera lagunensis DSM 15908]
MSANCNNMELINKLIELSRLNFTEEEIEKLCQDIEKIRSVLNQVSVLSKLDVKPLYNVWDNILNPPAKIGIEKIDIHELITNERSIDRKVKIPWRGE